MSKTTIIILLAGVLLFATFTCAGIGAYIYTTMPNPNPSLAETQLEQMVNAAMTQTAQVQSPTISPIILPSSTPTSPFVPPAQTVTPSVTLSPLSPILFTATPMIPQISVYVDTNCRVGPGKDYNRVGYLLVGQVSEIYGRNSAGDYWYIRNLNNNTAYCWLWGEYATVSGNIGALPIFTPPPTPTPIPSFEPSYAGKDHCTNWWLDIKLQNTGSIAFRSFTMTLLDTVTSFTQTLYADSFTDNNGCTQSYTNDILNPGTNRIVSSPPYTYDPTGHLMRVTTTVCTNTGQSGTCLTKSIEFTP